MNVQHKITQKHKKRPKPYISRVSVFFEIKLLFIWRRWESNPRPEAPIRRLLRV